MTHNQKKTFSKVIQLLAGIAVLFALWYGNWAMAAFFAACELQWEYKYDKLIVSEAIDEYNRAVEEAKARKANTGT
jgi:hypothetical protein